MSTGQKWIIDDAQLSEQLLADTRAWLGARE
jgi:hypothetical protein